MLSFVTGYGAVYGRGTGFYWDWRPIFATSAVLSELSIISVWLFVKVTVPKGGGFRPNYSYRVLIRNVRLMSPVLADVLNYGVIVLSGASAPAIFQLHFNCTVLEYGWVGWYINCAYLLRALSVSGLIGFTHQATAACCALIASVLPKGVPAPFTLACIALSVLALTAYMLSERRDRS